ncbi:hypothetical protein HOLleu_27575 [Holothuria leucospilota]|uniref:Ig-like domain-containing protein n=1 Tax=Holothuria leucospilota TaxID=206669 RepID=A0A9Q1BQY0_HOLLE|nr:hypothetical protein HOLleu_27575 [Holothuria leucospilota]
MRFEFYIQVPFLVIFALNVQWMEATCPVTQPTCNGSYPVKGPLEFLEVEPSQVCCSGGKCTAYIGGILCFTCAAQNFCHINWVVNDSTPYPFCNHCEFCSYNNHTLVMTNSAFSTMKGNYSCELSNGTSRIYRHFEVEKICDKPVDDDYEPKPHQLNDGLCVDTNASLGKNVTFYCEFCTKDKYSETTLQWMKLVGNASMPSLKTWIPVEELNIKGTTFTTKRKELVNCYNPPYIDPEPSMQTRSRQCGIISIHQRCYPWFSGPV